MHGMLRILGVYSQLSIFAWFKYNVKEKNKMNTVIAKLSEYSFGAYLVHVLVIEQLDLQVGLNTLSFKPYVSIPIIAMIVFGVSFVVSAILNHIPILKKYVV